MTKQDLIDLLIAGIEDADSDHRETVIIRKNAAKELLSIVRGYCEPKLPRPAKEGQVLFFCADCGQSFWADPREDQECFAKWHYHRWHANCPLCKTEVTQNDRYWR